MPFTIVHSDDRQKPSLIADQELEVISDEGEKAGESFVEVEQFDPKSYASPSKKPDVVPELTQLRQMTTQIETMVAGPVNNSQDESPFGKS